MSEGVQHAESRLPEACEASAEATNKGTGEGVQMEGRLSDEIKEMAVEDMTSGGVPMEGRMPTISWTTTLRD